MRIKEFIVTFINKQVLLYITALSSVYGYLKMDIENYLEKKKRLREFHKNLPKTKDAQRVLSEVGIGILKK